MNNTIVNNNDSFKENTPPVFVKSEEFERKDDKVDYSKLYELPTIKTRYISILIDLIVILMLSLGISSLIEKIGETPDYIRGTLFIVVIILYEPILVSIGATIGQLLMNIRVRAFNNPERKLNFFFVLVRIIVKIFLGWISFITITFNTNRRAIHDFASNSIMISIHIKKA